MSLRDKLFIAGVFLFLIGGFISYKYDTNVCDPKWKEIERKLDFIRAANSVKKIELYKAYPWNKTNLVEDTIVLTEPSILDTIRSFVNSRTIGMWNHPFAEWDLAMRLTLSNNEILEIKVNKIENDKEPNMTHMLFGPEHCYEKLPNCSLQLGKYLEKLTGYKGIPH